MFCAPYPMRLLIATLILTACAPGVTVYPGLHCQAGRADGGNLYEKALDRWEECVPMVRVKIESWSGE